MAYQALYRKFRPDRFEDVRGQDAIVTTLKNQIRADRIGHAYLFCGTRGTGKTTVAKLFAKSVNCTDRREDGSPCGQCESCRAIAAGASMNVIEMDAASNNGVDDVRRIREDVAYSPADARFKVYIIDEVHMLSTPAFNALLKTLEEPPSYVIFILATTEANRIPVTILSRCQRYDFRRMTIDTIVERLQELSEAEGIPADEKALRYIAKCANGSMRDALSLLDQCAAFYMGQELTYDRALEVLGAVDTEVYSRFLRTVLGKDINGAIRILEDVLMQGRELTTFVSDFTWYLRNLLLAGARDQDMEDVIDVSRENLARMKEEAGLTDPETLMRFIRIFSNLSSEIRFSGQKRVLTEIAVIRLMRPEMETDLSSMKQRISDLEKRLEEGAAVRSAAAASLPEQKSVGGEKEPDKALGAPVPLPAALPGDVEGVARNWKQILKKFSELDPGGMNWSKMARPTVVNDQLVIVFEDELTYKLVRGIDLREEETGRDALGRTDVERTLSEAINTVMKRDVPFRLELARQDRPFDRQYPDLTGLIRFDGIETIADGGEEETGGTGRD